MKTSKILINTSDGKYPILIGNNLSLKLGNLLKKNNILSTKILLVIDTKVPRKIVQKIKNKLKKKIFLIYINSNEKNKSQNTVNKIINILLKNNFNRNDCLISIGGGIIGDLSAFAASIFKRGLFYVNIPTTLLAQVDSSIGGKTGINSKYGKNLIGSFYQPKFVISDISFLKSLPKREILCGYAEIFKHSLISDKVFFSFLDKNIKKILDLKSSYIKKAIYKSCIIKKNIVEKDFKEKNLRKVLNFGHTFGHAYEASLKYSSKLNHGEAVILGISSAAKFSQYNNIININEYKLIFNHIKKINKKLVLKNFFKKNSIKKIIKFMSTDKKNSDNNINLILIKKIGKVNFNYKFNVKKIEKFLLDYFNII
tara:strand:+ start:224 stop:1330 length:1107 start_codon:yes stop_codon:yes gene_type:complete